MGVVTAKEMPDGDELIFDQNGSTARRRPIIYDVGDDAAVLFFSAVPSILFTPKSNPLSPASNQ
jgi:hypothetical protein